MQSRVRFTYRLTLDGLLVCLALVLSYLESITGMTIPIPGAGLGLANLAVMYSMLHTGKADAALISLVRVSVMSALFGNVQYFMFSLFGGAAAYVVMLVICLPFIRGVGRIGLSVAAAAAHSVGQIVAAAVIYSTPSLFAYLPLLLLIAILTGSLNGFILILIENRLPYVKIKGEVNEK